MLASTIGAAAVSVLGAWLILRRFRRPAIARRGPLAIGALTREMIFAESNTVTLAQRARLPHDVVTLTVHLTKVAPLGQKLPAGESSAAQRQKRTR